jgi:phosphonate transport system substrate-binding protein
MISISTLILLIVFSGLSQAAELTIGLIPEQNVFKQVERYKPLGKYIEEKAGIKIEFTMLSRYGNIIERFQQERMDGAFWGSFTGAMAIKQLGVEPIVRPLWLDGTSTYHGHIFVRKDSNIRNVADMRGKSIAFVEKATTAGYVFPMAHFKEHGVNNLDAYFREYYFTGSHDAAVHALLDREADVGCAKNTIYDMMGRNDHRVEKELIILAESPNVPSNGLGMRKTLDGAIKRRLREVLLGMDREPEGKAIVKRFGAIRFLATIKEDYAPVFDIAQKAGIDIRQYSYRNK